MASVHKYLTQVKYRSGYKSRFMLANIRDAIRAGVGDEFNTSVYKVLGENTIVAVIGGNIEKVMDELNSIDASIDICTTLLGVYEHFAKDCLGVVEEGLCDVVPVQLAKEGRHIFLLDFTVEYTGLTIDKFVAIWRKEAETLLRARKSGQLDIEVFKVIGERKVAALISVPDGGALDRAVFNLPIMQEMGNNVKIKCKAVEPL